MVVMGVPAKRPGVGAKSWGRLVVMQGESSPHKDMAILNLGWCIGFGAAGLPMGIFTHCMKIFGMLDCLPGIVGVGTVVAGMTRCLELPRGGGVTKEPRGWALWYLLLLSLPDSWTSSSTMAGPWGGVIMTQGDGGSSERTSSSINVIKGLMHLLGSLTQSTNWHGSPGCRGLATLAKCYRAFAYARVFSGCFNQKSRMLNLGSSGGRKLLCSIQWGWAMPCNCCAPPWHNSTPWAYGSMPLSSLQTLRYLLSGEQPLALATRSESPPYEHTNWPMHGGHGRAVQASLTDWAPPHHHQMTLSQTGIITCVGLRLVGLQGHLWQIGTNLLFHLNCQLMKNSHPLPWDVSDPPFLWSHLSCWMERGSDHLPPGKTSWPSWGSFLGFSPNLYLWRWLTTWVALCWGSPSAS